MQREGKGLKGKGLVAQNQSDEGDGECRIGAGPDEEEANAVPGVDLVVAN